MRLSSPNPPPVVHPLTYRVSNPYHAWLNTLCVGAAIAAVAFLLEAIYSFAQLSARMRGVPRLNTLRTAWPFLLLGVSSFKWVAIWLLTTEDPSPHASSRIRPWLVRALASTAVIIVFMYVLRMFEEWRIVGNNVLIAVYSIDFVVSLLFWSHICWIAKRLEFYGTRWRAIVAMIGIAITIGVFHIGLRALPEVRGLLSFTPTLSPQNLRWAMTVLWMVIGALVMLRFAMGVLNEVRLDRQAIKE